MTFNEWLKSHYFEAGPVRWLAFGLEAVAGLTLFGMMLLTCVDVGGRYLFNNAFDGAVEITQIMLAIMVFAEMPVITWRGGHVIVDLFDQFIGKKAVRALALLAALLVSTSFYVVAIRIWELGERQIRRGVLTEYLELPAGYLVEYIAVMSWVTAAGMITYGIYHIFKSDNK